MSGPPVVMIRVLDPGPQTTVQDGGRTGQLRYGIPPSGPVDRPSFVLANRLVGNPDGAAALEFTRSEEHTSELQSRRDLVCRLLLEKKKKNTKTEWIAY